jgi:hypothetical protein
VCLDCGFLLAATIAESLGNALTQTGLNMWHSIRACTVLASCGTIFATASAAAQCNVYRIGVPDFDQHRAGLPGGGACFCAPTAASNWFAFIANNGYPDVFLGPQDWQAAASYADATALINGVGIAMNTSDGTDPDEGGPLPPNPCTTTFAGFRNGATAWLDSVEPGRFIVSTVASNGADTISPAELSALLSFGALPAVSYRSFAYFPPNPTFGLPARWVLQPAGHVVSMTRVTGECTSSPRIWYRDPAGSTGENTSQSPFVTHYSDLLAVPGFYAADADSPPVFRTMWLMADVSSTNMLNAVLSIAPVHGLWAQPDSGEVVLGGMWNPGTLTIQPPETHVLSGATGIVSLRMSPRFGQALIVYLDSAGATRIGRLELHSSTLVPLGAITSPGPFVFTRSGRVIGLEEGNRLIYADIGGTSLVRSKAITLTRSPVAIAADDAAGQAILLLPAVPESPAAAIQRADDATLVLHAPEDLPEGVVVDANSSIAFDAGADVLYLATSTPGAAAPLLRITRAPSSGQFIAQPIIHPHIVEPRAIQTTHRGTIVFESQGICRALKFNPTLEQWVPDTDHPLAGQSIAPIFDLATSRTVTDSLDPDGEFDNLLTVDSGPGIPDCIADFNNNGVVQVTDIFAFLSAWFTSDLTADADLDGDTDVPDIFGFLAIWFAGCG